MKIENHTSQTKKKLKYQINKTSEIHSFYYLPRALCLAKTPSNICAFSLRYSAKL